MKRLQPEIELLNPTEGSRRLEPLEDQAEEQQKRAKSLNVEYKMSVMAELQQEARELEEKGQKAVDDMGKVKQIDENRNCRRDADNFSEKIFAKLN